MAYLALLGLHLLTTSEALAAFVNPLTPFGYYNNENPFNTAFVLGIPTPSGCSNAKVQRLADMEEITETGGNTTAIAALN